MQGYLIGVFLFLNVYCSMSLIAATCFEWKKVEEEKESMDLYLEKLTEGESVMFLFGVFLVIVVIFLAMYC